MTELQFIAVEQILEDNLTFSHSHSGDCIGADEHFYKLARLQGLHTVGHPPSNPSKRAFCVYDEEREPDEYLVRNHAIVDESSFMIFTPKEFEEKLRSGTWATARYTDKRLKPGIIVFPDGHTVTLKEFFHILLSQ